MPNNLGLSGAQAQKPVRFAPIYTGRITSGIWTNRSPLRDATTTRIVEKFYGPAGDALIAGSNVEITNRLTLARRPGTSPYTTQSFGNVLRFYEFRIFSTTQEIIELMIDTNVELFGIKSDDPGTVISVFTKSPGAGQTYMQSVGNTLYFSDGVDNKKYLQTLFQWSGTTELGTATTPFFTTYMIDTNGNFLQLYGTQFPITGTTLIAPTSTAAPTVQINSSVNLTSLLNVGDFIMFPAIMNATYLERQTSQILSIDSTGTFMIVTYPQPFLTTMTTTVETVNGLDIGGGNPITGTSSPIAVVGSYFTSNFAVTAVTNTLQVAGPPFGITVDGSAVWISRSYFKGFSFVPEPPLFNWGMDNTHNLTIVPSFTEFGPQLTYDTYTEITAGNLSGTTISGSIYVIDSNGNLQHASSGTTAPDGQTPNWTTILGETTNDNTVVWTLAYKNILNLFNGGWRYAVALVNTVDNTVSNISPLSQPTGNVQGAAGVLLPPGAGLSTFGSSAHSTSIDSQADYVAIFRTTDGQATPFLIPGVGTTYTIPLGEYLAYGYVDTTPDTALNNLISAPQNLENTPPETGAINLTLHLNRIFYSIGNVVYWTSGPDTPVGNGLNGTNPLNFVSLPSFVTRLVPTTAGLMIFTVSDVYILQGSGTASSPLQGAVPLLPGIGLLSYNALDVNGALIGLFTTDNQFLILDPSSGTTFAGFPIGDQFRLNNGTPGQSWNPANVYVAWHSSGEDQAWYVADGTNGWYRLMPTPAPESGFTWCPFASITNGAGCVQSVEVTPGVHRLLIGPKVGLLNSRPIYQRDLAVFTDNGTSYAANATVGSIVLAQPGQVATVDFITTESVATGVPIMLGILVDEALPYYTGPIDYLKQWVNDPPTLKPSSSIYAQRFYLSTLKDQSAVMRHCQIQLIWSPYDTVQNELFTLTIFGSYLQEI